MAESLGEAFIEVLADTSPFGEGLEEGVSEALSGVEDEVSEALGGVGDAADGAFDGIGDAAAGAADDVSGAFDGVGDAIADEVEAGVADASSSLDGFTDALGSMQGVLATAAGGAGLEGFARSQQDATLAVQRSAGRLGETEDEVRGMIDGITDWTFSSADAATGMEILSQRGVDNLDTMEELLPVWDNFADATGQDFVQAMEGGSRALGLFDIPADEAEEHMDTLTFMTTELGVDMDQLGQRFIRNKDELDDLGLGIDDTAGLMKALQDGGLDSDDALRKLSEGVRDSDGDMDQLLDTLGLTKDEFAEYAAEVDAAEGLTEQRAKEANDLATPMERLGGFVENVAFRFGDLGQMAGMLAAPLGALGPAMMTLNFAGPMVGKALGGVTKAFATLGKVILANPLFLIAAVIIGIIAVVWIFRDEIMAALGAAWDWIKDTAGAVWGWLSDTVGNVVDSVVEFVSGLRDRVVEFFQAMVDFVMEYHPIAIAFRLVQEYVPRIIEWITDLVATVVETVTGWVESVVDLVTNLWERWVELVQGIRDAVVEWVANLVATVVETVSGWVETIVGFVTDLWNRWVDLVHTIRDAVIDAITGLVSTVVDTISGWVSDLLGFVANLKDDFVGTISDLVDDVLGFFRDLPGNILSALGDLGSLLFDIGKDIIGGLISGIGDMAGAAVDAVKDVGSSIVSGVTGFLGMSSPSKVMAEEVGGPIMDGVAMGVRDSMAGTLHELERFANEATDAAAVTAPIWEAELPPRARTVAPAAVDPTGVGAGQGAPGEGVTQLVEMNVYTVDAERTARESVRRLRDVAYLAAPFDDRPLVPELPLRGGER